MLLRYVIIVICLILCRSTFGKETSNCSVSGVQHNYLIIKDAIFDVDVKRKVPYTYQITTKNVYSVSSSASNVEAYLDHEHNLILVILSLNENNIPSQESEYHLRIELQVQCSYSENPTITAVVPVIDTNNHDPFFSQPTYVYNLMSVYMEDFKRQFFLHPIVATDFDISNTELIFSVQDNSYFDITYGGTIPGTLKKKHFAQLTPKFSIITIKEKLELSLTVRDMGDPFRTNSSKLVINPPSPPVPVFHKPFYIAHLYKNFTLKMENDIELLEGMTLYDTRIESCVCRYIQTFPYSDTIYEKIFISESIRMDNYNFYTNSYDICTLKVSYTDKITQISSTGTVPIFVPFHHDL